METLDIDILTICQSLRRLLRCFVVCSLFRTSNIVLRLRYLLVHTMPVPMPMNREEAMLLYGERRRRTALVYLDRDGGTYKRSDVLSMLEITVSLSMVEAIGQLQNNWTWEILFRNEATKDLVIAQDEVLVKQHRAVVADFHRQTRKLRVVRVPTCVPNEFLAAKLKEVGATVKHIAHEINVADGLMSNVRIATIECKSVDTVPDTLRWSFDGLTGVALLFIRGRPPRCHRCGARDHKVAECIRQRTYASTMRGDMDDDGEGYDNDDDDNEEQDRRRAPASQPTAESAANFQDHQSTEQPTEMAAADGASDGAGVTSESPEAMTAAATTDERMESEQSGSDGDGESSAAESEASTAEFKQPRAHQRRRKRANKRNVERGSTASDTNGQSKKAKVPESASDSEMQSTGRAERAPPTTDELDPTTGRRNSRTRIPTSRRPPRAEIDSEQP